MRMKAPPAKIIKALRDRNIVSSRGPWEWSRVETGVDGDDIGLRWVAFGRDIETKQVLLVNVVAVTGKYLIETFKPSRRSFTVITKTPVGV